MYVPITLKLKEQVQRRVEDMCRQDCVANDVSVIADVVQVELRPDTMLWDTLHTLLWGEHLYLKDLMPESWLAHAEIFRWGDDNPVLMLRPSRSILVPPSIKHHWRGGVIVPGDVPEFIQNLPEVVERDRRRQLRGEINQRWHAVGAQLRTLLDRSKSLNEALKFWPDLRVYIPDDMLEKVEEKRGKSALPAVDVLAGLDLEQATAAYVGLRVSGGSA